MAEQQFETPEVGALWGLYFALYNAPGQWWRDNVADMPSSILRAYSRVQRIVEAREAAASDLVPLRVDEFLDPLRYITNPEGAESRG